MTHFAAGGAGSARESRTVVTAAKIFLSALAVASSLALAASGFEELNGPSRDHAPGQTATLLPDGRWLYIGGRDAAGQVTGAASVVSDAEPPLRAQGAELQLAHPRSGHSATVLPDGSVFVFGGEGVDGALVEFAEIVDVARGTTSEIDAPGLEPRKGHTATLLTSGKVLVVGGAGADGQSHLGAQLWDPASSTRAEDVAQPVLDRHDHAAALLANGMGLISGGVDASGQTLESGELFDPVAKVFEPVEWFEETRLAATSAAIGVEETIPAQEADDVDVDVRVAVRLSERLDVTAVNASTVSLVGPSGAVKGSVVAAEAGRLLFFTPNVDLWPGTTYTLFLKGLRDRNDRKVPTYLLTFTTRELEEGADAADGSGTDAASGSDRGADAAVAAGSGGAPSPQPASTQSSNPNAEEDSSDLPSDDPEGWEDWIPQKEHRTGNWRLFGVPGVSTPRVYTNTERYLTAAQGQTAVSGRVAKLNGRPLRGVTVSLGSVTTTTDPAGRFLLVGVPIGTQQLEIDASAVFTKGRQYGRHFVYVEVASGQTNKLTRDVFLSRIDPASEISIASPTTQEVVLTHPLIPGMEIRLPKGSIIRDARGNVVNKLSITPVPVDRAPTDVPSMFPVYFTMQPAGAVIENKDPAAIKAARVRYPNYPNVAADTTVDFWNYDPKRNGWYVYGQGRVTYDRAYVEPNPGTGAYVMLPFGWSVANTSRKPPTGPSECKVEAADPIDCATGLFFHEVTDVFIKDVIPINLKRVYRPNDPYSRAFGPGTSHTYEMFLDQPGGQNTKTPVYLVLPDGGSIKYDFMSGDGTAAGSIWRSGSTPGPFHGSTLENDPDTSVHQMLITLRDQTVLIFDAHTPNRFMGIRDRFGNKLTVTRSVPNGPITRITSSNGRYVDFSYVASTSHCVNDMSTSERCIAAITDNIGRTVQYEYYEDPSDAPRVGRLKKVTDQNGEFETYTYDANGRMESVFDKRANRYAVGDPNRYPMMTNLYYADGRVQQQTVADGGIWKLAYADVGGGTKKTTVTDPRNNVTERYFNSENYILREVRAVGTSVEQTYVYERDPVRQLLLSVTDPLNRTTKFDYDASGRLTSVKRMYGAAMERTVSYAYDGTGLLESVTDPLGHTTRLGYDELGSVTGITDTLAHLTSFASNNQGQPISVTNPLGKKTTVGYAQGDVASFTDPLGRTTSIFTDSVGRVMSVANALGNRSMFEYDGRNRVKRVTDALFGETKVEYDANGNVSTVTDPRKLTPHGYGYDKRNRVATYTDPLSRTEYYFYEDFLNLTKYTDRKGQNTLYSYDALNRLDTVTFQDGSTIRVKWDAGNRPYEVADSLNGTITLQVDDFDRLKRETTAEGTIDYTYDAAGRRSSTTVAGGTPTTYTYDDANRVTAFTQSSNVVSKTYYDDNRLHTLTYPNGVVTTYGYDDAGNVASINYSAGSNSITYTYDAAGRRIARNSTNAVPVTTPAVSSATYDNANQLEQWGTQAVTYDNNGNMTSDGTNTFVWNARNQLASLNDGAKTVNFTYDAFGRRRSKGIAGYNATYYHYDGLNIVRETYGGSPQTFWTGLGLDETFSRPGGADGPMYFLTDDLNSTVQLTNSAGGFVRSYDYDVYGNSAFNDGGYPIPPFPGDANHQEYAGRENDGTGLLYMRARYYNPKFGRFISSDPLGLAGGLNTHAYALGNPVSLSDPLGLSSDDIPFIPALLGVRDFDDPRPPKSLTETPEKLANAVGPATESFFYDALLPALAFSPAGAMLAPEELLAAEACEVLPAINIDWKMARRAASLARQLYRGTLRPMLRDGMEAASQNEAYYQAKWLELQQKQAIEAAREIPSALPAATQPK